MNSPTPGSTLVVGGDDTIAALATPAGRSALAVVRMSGPGAFQILRHVTGQELPKPRSAALRTIKSSGSLEVIDRSVVTVFAGPRSYTGEDMVEISSHGGNFVPYAVLAALISSGAREALPGEFSRRAVLIGKMDLIQAEAVADIIDARSRGTHAAAMRQLDGGLSERIRALRSQLLEIEALIAYDIDFPEEDDGPIEGTRITQACDLVSHSLSNLLATASVGELIREGALVVIAGPPNAGKSSLFNALLGQSRALVTEVAGTTRDAIEAVVDADPWTLRLVDTAGLRETEDVVERLGIEVSEKYLGGAHIVLACGEDAESALRTSELVRPLGPAPVIAVRTKADLTISRPDRSTGPDAMSHLEIVATGCEVDDIPPARFYSVSALTGAGLEELLAGVGAVLGERYGSEHVDTPMLMRVRHQRAVASAKAEVDQFRAAWLTGELPLPVIGTHLRAAVVELEDLVGAIGVDDVLDRVFSSFCVGK